jgi:hypothetical protein
MRVLIERAEEKQVRQKKKRKVLKFEWYFLVFIKSRTSIKSLS